MNNAFSANVFRMAVAVALATAVHAHAEPAKDSYEETIEQSFPLSAGGTLTLENRNGSIEVDTWDKDEVRVVATKRIQLDGGGWWIARLIGLKRVDVKTDAEAKALLAQLSVEFSGDDSRRSVRTIYPEVSGVNCSVAYRITAPRKMKLDLDTVNGGIRAKGVEGDMAVATTSGSVTVADVVGRVNAISTNGRIHLDGIAGPVIARTTNGAVSVRLADTAPMEAVEMESVNGSVSLTVPSGANFAISARTTNGSVRCNLPHAKYEVDSRKHVSGVVGESGPQVELSTTNGSVQVNAIG